MAVEVVFTASGPRYDRAREVRNVDLAPFPTDSIDRFERSGLWVEVRDAANRVVYRRVMQDRGNFMEGPGEKSDLFVRILTKQRPPLRAIVPYVEGGRVVLMMSDGGDNRAYPAVDVALPRIP